MDISHPKILYGSETGTAEDVAFKISSVLHRCHVDCSISCMEDYDISVLPTERFVIFVVSTTGDGEAPSTMRQFWRFLLRKSLPKDALSGMQFAVFGLGDSGYDKFNAVARKLQMRLKQLGGTPALDIGLGDDQAGYGYLSALDPWMNALLNILCPGNTEPAPLAVEPAQYDVTVVSPDDCKEDISFKRSITPLNGYKMTTPDAMEAVVTANTRLTTPNWQQNVFHLGLRLPSESPSPSHQAGDVLIVHPSNPPAVVSMALDMYNKQWSADAVVKVRRLVHTNCRRNRLGDISCTLRDLFSHHLDITATPQRSFFESLSLFASDEEEKEKLEELSSAEGADLFHDYCTRERRGCIEILSEFKSCVLPLERLIELVPPLLPRHYSIASSGLPHCYPGEVHLCVALVEYVTPLRRKRQGVCSLFLSQLSPGDTLLCFVRRGSFPSPLDSDPLLLVGPGTGVAPMRAFLQERSCSSALPPPPAGITPPTPPCPTPTLAPTLLLFGCRSEADDFLYREEWEALSHKFRNTSEGDSATPQVEVLTAFSRKGPNSGIYVTHIIKSQGPRIWELINKPTARIYIAGSAATKMPGDVRKALVEVITCHSEPRLTDTAAERFLHKMEIEKRFCVEAWS